MHIAVIVIKPEPLCREVLAPFKEDMDKARDLALGDPKNRDLRKARLNRQGVWTGGARFEHSRLAVNVEGAERCYPLGQSYQAQRKLSGPTVGAKISGEVTNHHKLRQFVLKVCISRCCLHPG